jgi:glycosyltransferase involved in cell wall biosynthesis
MKDEPPRVSIGLAVFNGERYLSEAIASILAQTFANFELIISDNASTDATEQICRDYARHDKRIRYSRLAKNIGGTQNANRTFGLARGHYFRMAAHDDILAPDLLRQCVNILDRHQSVVLCYSSTMLIDEHDRPISVIQTDAATSAKPHLRFRNLAQQHDGEMAYGLIRSAVLRQTELQPNYPESDFGFLCELSLHGQFYRIPEVLFYRRHHSLSSSAQADIYQKMAWHQPHLAMQPSASTAFSGFHRLGCVFSLFGQELAHYSRILGRSPVGAVERLYCSYDALRWLLFRLVCVRSRPWRRSLGLTRAGLNGVLAQVHYQLIGFVRR